VNNCGHATARQLGQALRIFSAVSNGGTVAMNGHATARQQQRLAMNLELLLCIGNTLIRRQRMVWGQFINRIDGAGVGGLDVDSQGVLLQGAMAATTLRASSATVIF